MERSRRPPNQYARRCGCDPTRWRFQMFWYHDLRRGCSGRVAPILRRCVPDQLPETSCSKALIRETLPNVV
jgi:hypothetical protein